MKRRNFLQNILPMSAAPLMLNGIPIRAMANNLMTQAFTCDQINDRVLVLIQLHGGNDGLNTMIPIDQYDLYKNLRPIIGILDEGPRKFLNIDSTLGVPDQFGLHPDMTGIKDLYEQGKVNFIQNVAYPNNNGSHFRGTDIWLSGKDGTAETIKEESGWFGRYLDHKFPNFPDAYPTDAMPDPPGLEFGTHIVSLGFHRKAGIPMGMTLSNNPSTFYDQLSAVGGLLPDTIPDSDFGKELKYIIEVERSTNVYAEVLKQHFENGSNSPNVTYPEAYHTSTTNNYNNRLSGQLRTIARLISGGCKTKVYLARITGFDTHANQAIAGKPSFGGHGALLYHLSEAVKAFQDDLKELGVEDRVLTATFSEFGRQVKENGDWGTDHGSSAPMMIFGKGVTPGVTGTNPNLSNLKNNRLQDYQHDYRQVFATILQDWLGANNGSLDAAEFYEFSGQKLDLINSQYNDPIEGSISFVADTSCDDTPDLPPLEPTSIDTELAEDIALSFYPNPATDRLNISLESKRLIPITVELYDSVGSLVRKEKVNLLEGNNSSVLQVDDLAAGMYVLRIAAAGSSARAAKSIAVDKVIIR